MAHSFANNWMTVSTHSRLKAAGRAEQIQHAAVERFNTQPPEGGWNTPTNMVMYHCCFNTQPPEGGW